MILFRKVPRFGGVRGNGRDIRPFIGWGLPSLVTIAVMAIDLSPMTSHDLMKPNFAVVSCWFYGKTGIYRYLYLHITVKLNLSLQS